MKLFFMVLAALLLCAQVAHADGEHRPCRGAGCDTFQGGPGRDIRGNPECLVEIRATQPLQGFVRAFLDVRDASRVSILKPNGRPYTKRVVGDEVAFRINCQRLQEAIEVNGEVYLCVGEVVGVAPDGKPIYGATFSQVVLARTGKLEEALRARRLVMCLGPDCSDFTGGPRPAIDQAQPEQEQCEGPDCPDEEGKGPPVGIERIPPPPPPEQE